MTWIAIAVLVLALAFVVEAERLWELIPQLRSSVTVHHDPVTVTMPTAEPRPIVGEMILMDPNEREVVARLPMSDRPPRQVRHNGAYYHQVRFSGSNRVYRERVGYH